MSPMPFSLFVVLAILVFTMGFCVGAIWNTVTLYYDLVSGKRRPRGFRLVKDEEFND